MSDISIYITSDLTSSERKVSPQWSITHLKIRLEQITGIAPKFQTIHLYRISNSNEYEVVADSNSYNRQADDHSTVVALNLVPFCRLHVVDADPNSEMSQLAAEKPEFESYQMTEEEYAKRSNTVLEWKSRNQLGRFDPQFNQEKARKLQLEEEAASSMKVGDRCRVINIQGERRGTIRSVGKIDVLDNGEGVWVGVEFDEPVGKNNGSIGSVRVFSCKDKHGSFIKPQKVEVGDYPELDPFGSDEEEL
ncbi:hypothetical protein PSN45_005124 [Yamadazyma tenuis]|uniref:CAP-Gly domain-containing protein n=1 Tax=Candida tenuis (strain ATCC 10573 / BCRC 21748 / CBS 615 / JCM 9827 / NBRC 10315 / NRRL Y-1498 / VKM Y-70) TaxID=590646 RepID=G3B2W2_CANTC|nr:uncharacterized protein CANTEDRAFT_103434 [Yamadazyma tenuis ATCC 10573]EGV64778.1 hypothetical protein CANTEDRAFT_103434 [Yamadazyma tenuis ATCC 10573]WEJ97568.1 hypothetical protein PSN45_005124 [Yamadazyma tenuis]